MYWAFKGYDVDMFTSNRNQRAGGDREVRRVTGLIEDEVVVVLPGVPWLISTLS